MTFATWKAEFYPEDASAPKTELEAVEHSIRKWEGLRPENLERHGVELYTDYVAGVDGALSLCSESCALCVRVSESRAEAPNWPRVECGKCPLAKARRGIPCDRRLSEEVLSPYAELTRKSDPGPMLACLYAARRLVGG